MNIALKNLKPDAAAAPDDRPGWIPPHITHDWDTNPYAYQTEEELMPAGGLHGQILAYIMEILRAFLEPQGLMLLMDTFMLYRDDRGIRQRIAPDLLLMPFRFPPPSAYDLDMEPPPVLVAEVTSPKSHLNDLRHKLVFYTGLGIPTYLAIDAITPRATLRRQIGLHLWRKTSGQIVPATPDSEGRLLFPEMNLCIRAQAQRLIFSDLATGELLRDAGQFAIEMEHWKTTASKERQRAEKLAEKLRSLGINLDDIE